MNEIATTLNLLLRAKEEDMKKVKRARRRMILRKRRLESEVK